MPSDDPQTTDGRAPSDLAAAAGGDPLGFEETVERALRELSSILRDLRSAREGGAPGLEHPFVLDSASACISTYVEALDRVRRRFWTTTLLSSGFWTHRIERILAANSEMSHRVERGGGRARRLFLLDRPPEQVAEEYRERRILLDRTGKEAELARFDEEFEALVRNVRSLASEGCEVRIVFDPARAFADLPGADWNSDDCELAIYDEFRVDVFEGGRTGGIRRVTSFSRAMRSFDRHLAAAEAFFAALWERSDAIADFLAHLEEVVAASRKKIHYRANWLARYEFALDEDDAAVKTAEARRIREVLEKRHLWGGIRTCLDVGTCTGRYPILISRGLAPEGRIVGVDDDPECVRFARSNVHRHVNGEGRIELVQGDFGARELELPHAPYQLLTCMMSTVSHFGRDRSPVFDDPMQAALRRFSDLLDPDGLLVFTTWSRPACEAGTLLSIYDESDTRRLARWTPDRAEMEARLRAAGFATVSCSRPHPRLDFWTCGKRG